MSVTLLLPVMIPALRQLAEPPMRYTGGGLPKGWIMIVVGSAIYVLPSLLAWKSGHRRRVRITLINLLLGWTIIGWVVSMVLLYAYQPPPEGEEDVAHEPGTIQRKI